MNSNIDRINAIRNSTKIYCKTAAEVPKEKHWAIIKSESTRVPGYDRGDPEDTLHYITYIAFKDKAEWEREVAELVRGNMGKLGYSMTSFSAMEVFPATIETEVKVNIGLG